MWTPPRQRRLSAALSPYSGASVASSRLELQPWSPPSVPSSPDRATAIAPPLAAVAPAAPDLVARVGARGARHPKP